MKRSRVVTVILLGFLMATLGGSEFAHAKSKADGGSLQINIPIERYTLDNGMVVILHRDDSVPLVAFHKWFRVGSRHERPGITGIAHMFEHLMFRGTEKYPEGEFDRILHSSGATYNAFTSHDYTGYYEVIPPEALETVMDLESDRMRNLIMTDQILSTERGVVQEERRQRVDNNPMGRLSEHLFGTMFRSHPYRWPIIGWMKDIQAYSLKDLGEWYDTYYAPNNAILVVAGQIDLRRTKALIEKYYGHMEPREIPASNTEPEAEPKGFVSSAITSDVQAPTVVLAYPTVQAGNSDMYSLDLLAQILGSGSSSRLHQRLVYRTQVATRASTWHYTPQTAGMLQTYVNLKPGGDVEGVRTALLGEMYRLRNHKVSPEELSKAKAQVMLSSVGSLKSIQGKAYAMALNEIYFENPLHFLSELEKYNAVTVEDLHRVAEKYLTPQRATFVVLRPRG